MFIYMVFSVRPEITKPQHDIWKILNGESTTIECLADASPRSQYVWKKESGGVVVHHRFLQLNNVDESDGGYYTCTAENSLGSVNFTILVQVTSKFIYIPIFTLKFQAIITD